MATITKTIAQYSDGLVTFSIEYDSSNLRMTAFRCVNNSGKNAWGHVYQEDTGRSYEMTFPPGNFYQAIPTGAAQRLQLSVGTGGKIAGVGYQFTWPYE